MQKYKISEELWNKTINKCLGLVNSCNDIVSINIYGELINKIDSFGQFSETEKIKYIQILKRKQH